MSYAETGAEARAETGDRAGFASSSASPLMLCDRLISLAQEADRAGHVATATQLIRLAHTVLDEEATPRPC